MDPVLALAIRWDPVKPHLCELGCHLLDNHKGKAMWPFCASRPSQGDQKGEGDWMGDGISGAKGNK